APSADKEADKASDDDAEVADGIEDEEGPERSSMSVGIDPFQLGFNPHLVADDTELVDAIADLVLPSAFHGNIIDSYVLNSAREIDAPPGIAQRVRYSIKDSAQWSDGTPITGADFCYLLREMVSSHRVREVAP